MTIKEIENRSGISRANIRFYETEGLLHPKRQENGYRDYSEDDMLALQKIKLLRSMGISLESIRDIKGGRITLQDVLEEQMHILFEEKEKMQAAENICQKMYQDRVTFDSMEPEKYTALQPEEETEASSEIYQKPEDTEPYIRAWRRYFARMMDVALIRLAGFVLLSVVFHINTANFSFPLIVLSDIAALVILMLLEPLLLHWFGTTPGKFLLGLYLEEEDGRKPSLSNARLWSGGAVVRGMGLGIPILYTILLIVSFLRSYREEELPWQYLVYRQKPKKIRQVFCYLAAVILLVMISTWSFWYVLTPPNRGSLTVAEFAENYNRMHKAYGIDDNLYLTENGEYKQDQSQDQTSAYVGIDASRNGEWEYEISYEMDRDQIRGITVKETGKDPFMAPVYSDRMFLMLVSFAGAEEEMGVFFDRNELGEQLEQSIIAGQRQVRIGDTDFSYDLEMENMSLEGTTLFSAADMQAVTECTITYTMSKNSP